MYAKNFSSQGPHWLMGYITKFTGPVSVLVKLEDGSLVKRHFDQIRKKLTRTSENTLILRKLKAHLHLCHILLRTVQPILRLIQELHQLSHNQPTVISLLKLSKFQFPIL